MVVRPNLMSSAILLAIACTATAEEANRAGLVNIGGGPQDVP
jgi:hypothetical protein